ncbi:antiterminator Q family protein [Candidatus Williamhamiltonella defendens]|uniref:Antitermination protein Q n=1 Tax=Candidatus Hamiltonella defensa (Bemisia tabaci) TaxID=672795 RepID=A0A249DXE5_9ENTR|nr:antiterminator Q family protein [Candidatus Hamiltonella defensa]ACJ10106.1 Q protein [Bacteriophage APSE-7]ASX26121.1 antitermination protein Q [Candidatus Hamiltonella defensa (Bemisia tabaci)]CED78232.1 APSE-2 prophage Q protein [Candidatus Hamiltonella defensa (Bemisia tabaci)]
MRRDIQQVLERWGTWARDNNTGIEWSPIAAGFKGLLPLRPSLRRSCSYDDGRIIDNCVLQLQKVRQPEELNLIIAYYVKGYSKRAIARRRRVDERLIRAKLQIAEGFIDGCLSLLAVRLDMDPEVKIYAAQKCEKSISAVRKKFVNVL